MAVLYFQRGLDLYEIAGDINGQAIAHDLIATANFHTGQWQEAERQYSRAREIFALIGNKYSLALADNNLGGIALNQGRLDEAIELYQRALHSLEQIGESVYVQAALHVNLGHAYLRRSEAGSAHEHLRAAEALYEQAQARDWLPEMYRHFAEAALLDGDLSEAEARAVHALELARELSMRNEEGNSLRVLAQIASARDQLDQARKHLDQSVRILGQAQDRYEWARSVLALARVEWMQGRAEECVAALDRCQPVFERLGASLEVAEGRALRGEIDRASQEAKVSKK
jgi:tetratricopeptide (TPR) repeat protein